MPYTPSASKKRKRYVLLRGAPSLIKCYGGATTDAVPPGMGLRIVGAFTVTGDSRSLGIRGSAMYAVTPTAPRTHMLTNVPTRARLDDAAVSTLGANCT